MVYCTKCGTKNEDDAKVCVNCGANLETEARVSRRYEKRMEEECFGIPRGGSIVGMIIGLIIVLVGASLILSKISGIELQTYIGPLVIVIVGILIIVGAYYGMRRRY